MNPSPVIGRFAPSPSGDLHFGSLVSAVGSFLESKTSGGLWLLRIEDLDPPREVAGSARQIIDDLHDFGMHEDGEILFQSSRLHTYQRYVEQLLNSGKAYHCACTRKDMPASGIYPGTCRNGIRKGREPRAIRFRVDEQVCDFDDYVQGHIAESAAQRTGDFIIHRADGLYAYQLAVVVDDEYQGITQVVRGADLLDSTCRQLSLQSALGFKSPGYMHLPLAVSNEGKKLSKRLQTDPITLQDPAIAVASALAFLGQTPPTGLPLGRLWDWALQHWNSELIPRHKSIIYSGKPLNA